MTRLEANMKNLTIVEGEGKKCWQFRISKCDSIKETIGELKAQVPADASFVRM